jgi:hypothetical protein
MTDISKDFFYKNLKPNWKDNRQLLYFDFIFTLIHVTYFLSFWNLVTGHLVIEQNIHIRFTFQKGFPGNIAIMFM